MNELQIFNYGEIPVRTVLMDGEPWWVLADVCRVLNLTNSRMTAKQLDEDEKGVSEIYTPGGTQQMTIINEPGLYSVILRSDKPEAKAFKRWITHEVIPAIRKTGSYGVTITEKEPFTNEQRIKVMDILSRCTQFTLPHVLKYCDPEWPVSLSETPKTFSMSLSFPDKEEFGEWLKAALKEHGMTQRQLAQATGASPAAVSQYCSGKNRPCTQVYQSIMAILG